MYAGLERMLCVRARIRTGLLACAIPLLVVGNEIWLLIPKSTGVASRQSSDDHSVGEFSSGSVDSEDPFVPVASDLQTQVLTIQTVHKFVPNIQSDSAVPERC